MKSCETCKKSGKSTESLFLHHMVPILKHIKKRTSSRVTPIIWDDMLRKWTTEDMKRKYFVNNLEQKVYLCKYRTNCT